MNNVEYDKLFAAISAHFLTQELPNNWHDFTHDELEGWFVEYAVETYEYWDWEQVYAKIADITDTVQTKVYNT
mgnify:CR=1 FL=1